MPSFGSDMGRVLYLIVCAAPPARTATTAVVQHAQRAGWDVSVVATPAALDWLPARLAEVTGHPVRTETRGPDDSSHGPLGDAVLVAPATFNTINRWAAGINDTLALGLLNEALGRSIPVAVVPWINDALRAHPAYRRNVDLLGTAGVHFAAIEPTEHMRHEEIAVTAIDALHAVTPGRPGLQP